MLSLVDSVVSSENDSELEAVYFCMNMNLINYIIFNL